VKQFATTPSTLKIPPLKSSNYRNVHQKYRKQWIFFKKLLLIATGINCVMDWAAAKAVRCCFWEDFSTYSTKNEAAIQIINCIILFVYCWFVLFFMLAAIELTFCVWLAAAVICYFSCELLERVKLLLAECHRWFGQVLLEGAAGLLLFWGLLPLEEILLLLFYATGAANLPGRWSLLLFYLGRKSPLLSAGTRHCYEEKKNLLLVRLRCCYKLMF